MDFYIEYWFCSPFLCMLIIVSAEGSALVAVMPGPIEYDNSSISSNNLGLPSVNGVRLRVLRGLREVGGCGLSLLSAPAVTPRAPVRGRLTR